MTDQLTRIKKNFLFLMAVALFCGAMFLFVDHALAEQSSKPKTPGLFNSEITGKIESLNKLKSNDPAVLIGQVIKIGMSIIGSVALLMFVAGGIMWMTARGNAEQMAKAAKTLAWSALGVVVILASYGIVKFIFGAIER